MLDPPPKTTPPNTHSVTPDILEVETAAITVNIYTV